MQLGWDVLKFVGLEIEWINVDASVGVGMTYLFSGGPFGVRAEYTGVNVGDDFRVVTLGGFIRW